MSLSFRLGVYIEKNNVTGEQLQAVLAKYHLESLLPTILRFLKKRKAIEDAKYQLRIETPFPLDDQAIAHIQSLTQSKDEPVVTLNKELLAGFKATYNNTLYDGSAKRIIDRFINSQP